jgi:hypothetical protein
MAAMRRNERKGPGMVASSFEEEPNKPSVVLDRSEAGAGAALNSLLGEQKNTHKKAARKNADREQRSFMAKSPDRPARYLN